MYNGTGKCVGPADGLYGPEQLREVERLSTYNYRARLAGGEIVLAVVRGDGSLALIERRWTDEGI